MCMITSSAKTFAVNTLTSITPPTKNCSNFYPVLSRDITCLMMQAREVPGVLCSHMYPAKCVFHFKVI